MRSIIFTKSSFEENSPDSQNSGFSELPASNRVVICDNDVRQISEMSHVLKTLLGTSQVVFAQHPSMLQQNVDLREPQKRDLIIIDGKMRNNITDRQEDPNAGFIAANRLLQRGSKHNFVIASANDLSEYFPPFFESLTKSQKELWVNAMNTGQCIGIFTKTVFQDIDKLEKVTQMYQTGDYTLMTKAEKFDGIPPKLFEQNNQEES